MSLAWNNVRVAALVTFALGQTGCAASIETSESSPQGPSRSPIDKRPMHQVPSWGEDVAISPDSTRQQLEPGEYWKPDLEQVRDMRAQILLKVREHCSLEAPTLAQLMEKYNCQHIGVTHGETRSIWSMCMCRVDGDWKTKFERVVEGGSCYVEVAARLNVPQGLHVRWIYVHDSLGVRDCPEFYQPD